MTRGQQIFNALKRFANSMDKLRTARRKTKPVKCVKCNHYLLETSRGRRECPYCTLKAAYDKNVEAFDKQGKSLLDKTVALARVGAAARKVAALVTRQVYHREPSNNVTRYVFNRHDALIEAANKLKALLIEEEYGNDSRSEGKR